MRFKLLWAVALLPAGLWAGSIGLPGSDTSITFTSNQFGVQGCGSPCSIDGSTSPLPQNPDYMVSWTFEFTNPIRYNTDPSGQTGHFLLGTNPTPASFTLSDDDGAAIVGNIINPPVPDWMSSAGDGTVLRFEIDVASSTVPGGDPLSNILANTLGGVPQVGDLLIVQLAVTCTSDSDAVQCMGQVPDPTGSITGGRLSTNNSATTPEPGTMALLAGGFAAIAMRRLIRKNS